MESIKPDVSQEAILALLNETFQQPIRELKPVEGGQVAQVLSFWTGDEEYILRLLSRRMAASYQKEVFIYNQAAGSGIPIPIPPILKTGSLADTNYAISRKMPGHGLTALTEAEYRQTLPDILQTLYAIHLVDVQQQTGFGWFDDNGVGRFPSWKDHLAWIIEEDETDLFFGRWHDLFNTTMLEKDFFEEVYNHMLRLLDYCPNARWLVHSGYGYNNVLAEGGKVTAVLDWIDARYGDFVYDFAWLDMWPPFGIDYGELCRQYYSERGIPLSNYWERYRCYRLYMGLDALRFYALTNHKYAYQSVRDDLRKRMLE